jgi:hypothetical protein
VSRTRHALRNVFLHVRSTASDAKCYTAITTRALSKIEADEPVMVPEICWPQPWSGGSGDGGTKIGAGFSGTRTDRLY